MKRVKSEKRLNSIAGSISVLALLFLAFEATLYEPAIAGGYQFTRAAIEQDIASHRNQDGGFDCSDSYSTQYGTHALYLLSFMPDRIPELIKWCQSCQNPDGGFGDMPGKESSMPATYNHIVTLSYFGAQPVNRQACIQWIHSCQDLEGDIIFPPYGYGSIPGESGFLEYTFEAVTALKLLGVFPRNIDGIINFINQHQISDGGFSIIPKPLGEMFMSFGMCDYWGALALKELGRKPLDLNGFINHVRRLQAPNGGFVLMEGDDQTYVMFSYWAIHALAAVNSLPANVPKAREYFEKCENMSGGYGMDIQYKSPLPISTYMAIYSLKLMQIEPRYINAHINYMLSARNQDGAFGAVGKYNSEMEGTYYSVRGYDYLGTVIFPSTPLTDWVYSCENGPGGFKQAIAYVPGGSIYVTSSYYGTWILNKFGLRPSYNGGAVAGFIGTCHYQDENTGKYKGYKDYQDTDVYRIYYTHYALDCLRILNQQISGTEKDDTIEWLNDCQDIGEQGSTGGFGYDESNYGADIFQTFCGVQALHNLGEAPPDVQACLSFIWNSKNADGGFGYAPGIPSDYASTFWACQALDTLGALDQNTLADATNFIAYHWPNKGHGAFADMIGGYFIYKGVPPSITPATPFPDPTWRPWPTATPTPVQSGTPTITPTATPTPTGPWTPQPTPTPTTPGPQPTPTPADRPNAPTIYDEPACTKGLSNKITWSDESASGAVAYWAECSVDNFASIQSSSGWISAKSWTFTNLVDGWTYQYRVKARNAALHESNWSNVVVSKQDNKPPLVYLAGYWNTSISSTSGGRLTILAYIPDEQTDDVGLYYYGTPIGISLHDDGTFGDLTAGDKVYTFTTILGGGAAPGRYLLEIKAIDCAQNIGIWPYLSISSGTANYENSEEPSFELLMHNLINSSTLMDKSSNRPIIYVAGYWNTNIDFLHGGKLTLLAYVYDADGDIASVEIYYGLNPTGVILNDNGLGGDWTAGDGIYTFEIPEVGVGVPAGNYLLEIVAKDQSGNASYVWPYLTIE